MGSGPGWVAEAPNGADPRRDGLVRVPHSGFANAWVKPGETFAAYSTMSVLSPAVRYKRTPTRLDANVSLSGTYPSDPNFPLSDDQMAAFKGYVVDSFAHELRKSDQFRVVEEPEADSLIVAPAIVDLVMLVPLGQLPGGQFVFTTTTARMTLALELRDPGTGEVLARVVERTGASPPGANGLTSAYSSSPVDNVSALKTAFRNWGRTLRQRLDATRARAGSVTTASSTK
jgi:hypothetical protein